MELLGISLGLSAALFGAIAYNIVRAMNQTLHYIYSPFYNSFSGIFVIAILYFGFPNLLQYTQYDLTDCLLLSLASWGDLFAQICMSLSYKFEEASWVAPIMYLMIVFSYLSDILLFNYRFTLIETIASSVIIISIVMPTILRFGRCI